MNGFSYEAPPERLLTQKELAAIRAEESVIIIILQNPEKILSEIIDSKWFYTYRSTIESMQKMIARGVEIDAYSLSQEMRDDGLMATLAGWQIKGWAAKNNYLKYLDVVRNAYKSRQSRALIERALAEINSGEESADVLTSLISESMKISGATSNNFSYSAKEAVGIFIDKLAETFDARDTGGIGIKTGIKKLDDAMGGMHPSDLVIVGARPGVGKTAFAASVMRNVAKNGHKCGIFSAEMSVYQVVGRLVAIEAKINSHSLRHADLSDQDFSRLTVATKNISELDFRIYDKPSPTISEVVMQSRAWAADGGIDFILIDYLTKLKSNKPSGNQNLDVGDMVSEIKDLARILGIPIMLLAQLNRQVAGRKEKRPVMSDLRDSGIIEQEADQILMLYRPDNESIDESPEVIIEKNRHGECGAVRCQFVKELMQWTQMEAY